MDDMLKKLLSAEVLSEETKEALGEAVKVLITEAEHAAEAKVRGELAQRYEAERKTMVVAVEKYLEQSLGNEIKEFREGMSQVDALKSKYASAISSVKAQAKKAVIERLTQMEAHLDATLRAEIKELHEDMKVNRKAYLNKIAENQAQAETDRLQFRNKAAKVLENIINVKLTKEIADLKEDIQAAKQTHFEGQIFEAFYSTFRRQFFDTNKEFKNLTKKLEESEKKSSRVMALANSKITEANTKIKTLSGEKKRLAETVERSGKMNELLSKLTGSARTKMRALLEATNTSELDRTFKKFVGEVLNEGAPTQARRIDEAVVELNTGSTKRLVLESANSEDDDEIEEIMRRSGVVRKK